jgi:hypothetical protein
LGDFKLREAKAFFGEISQSLFCFAVGQNEKSGNNRNESNKHMEQTKKYTVFVDDNFHYMDESKRYEDKSYAVLEEAINRCREITIRSLKEMYMKGMDGNKLRLHWLLFGEDPFIPRTGTMAFSAREFITEKLCEEIIAECEA